MTRTLTVVGMPCALGGSLPGVVPSPAGMARAPAGLRALGLLPRLSATTARTGGSIHDAGDLQVDPDFRDDPDPRARNLALIAEVLPRERTHILEALATTSDDAQLVLIGGDCVAHAGAMAALHRRRPQARYALAWFDAHGDANDPSTTPSGNVWGMPLAMILGRGAPELVAACDGPTIDAHDVALVGGQVIDEQEARLLARGGVAHFGPGMLSAPAGMAAFDAWARTVAEGVDGVYIAIDMDVLDGAAGFSVQMPEADGLSLETAVRAVTILAEVMPVVGIGFTTINLDRPDGDPERTVAAVVELLAATLR